MILFSDELSLNAFCDQSLLELVNVKVYRQGFCLCVLWGVVQPVENVIDGQARRTQFSHLPPSNIRSGLHG